MPASREQVAWAKLAARLRRRLATRIGGLSEMAPDDVLSFVRALSAALDLEQEALAFDERLSQITRPFD